VSLLYGLHQALRQLREEGLDSVLERHARLATATREAVKALGLSVFAGCPANTVTSIRLPDGFDGKLLTSTLRDRHNVIFAGGQDHLMGRIIRIAHLGWMDDYDVIVAVSALERGLRECGLDVPLGSGVSAAQAVLGGQATEHSR
jgi:aspartate aminotransferase-like enzyme